MNPIKDVTLCLLSLSLAGAQATLSQERDRSKIHDQYKWNLNDIYPGDEAWRKSKEELIAELPAIEKYRGKLSSSSQSLPVNYSNEQGNSPPCSSN